MSKASATLLWSGGAVELSILSLIALVLMAGGAWLFLSSRLTAQQRERRRRIAVNSKGRMGDATITDVRDSVLFYSYQVRGVAYATSQDVSDLQHLLPADTSVLIGPAGLKFTPGNPADSILICEHWSGLRPAAVQLEESRPKENSHP
jgi:hypothetical protein